MFYSYILHDHFIIEYSTGVFGILDLYGLPPSVYHTKLGSTAAAGSSTLTLSQAVDWQVRELGTQMIFLMCLCIINLD